MPHRTDRHPGIGSALPDPRPQRADGLATTFTIVAALVDTNVLVYRYDARDAAKQRIASRILREGLREESLKIAHQGIVEFYAAVTRPLKNGGPILQPADATRETEELSMQFEVLYPTDALVPSALRATAAYRIGWFDALMWAYAETNGIDEILSEDFQNGRYYGRVRVINPFA